MLCMGLLGDDGQSVLFSDTTRYFMVQGHLQPTACPPADRTNSVLASFIHIIREKKKFTLLLLQRKDDRNAHVPLP